MIEYGFPLLESSFFPSLRGVVFYILPLLRGGEAGVDCSELENIICDIWIDFPFREKYDF